MHAWTKIKMRTDYPPLEAPGKILFPLFPTSLLSLACGCKAPISALRLPSLHLSLISLCLPLTRTLVLSFRDHHIIQDKLLNSRSLIYWQLQRPFFSMLFFWFFFFYLFVSYPLPSPSFLSFFLPLLATPFF